MENSTPPASAPAKPAAAKSSKAHAPIAFAILWVVAIIFSFLSFVALSAVFIPKMGFWFALILALVPAIVLPSFLIIRASAALKRKAKVSNRLRHIISIGLYFLIHAAILGVAFDWGGQSTKDVAYAAYAIFDKTTGEVPWLSGMLKKHAGDRRAPDEKSPDTPALRGDGGALPDASASTNDVAAPSNEDKPDAGVAQNAAALMFSPRENKGAVVLREGVFVKTNDGESQIALITLKAKGESKIDLLSLNAFKKAGPVTALDTSLDGSLAVVLGGSKVLTRTPNTRLLEVSALRRGAQVNVKEKTYEIRQVRDLVVSNKANLMLVTDLFEKGGGKGAIKSAWLAYNGRGVKVIRIAGDAIGESDSTAYDFSLRRALDDGSFVVVETFLEGGVGIPTDTSGETFQTNPQRLLRGNIDRPEAFEEVARTDAAAVGIKDKSVQLFFDAFSLPSAKVFFDSNFVEAGKKGWVFESTRQGLRALAPNGFETDTPFSSRSQSAYSFDINGLEHFAFIKSPQVITGELAALNDAKVHTLKEAATLGDAANKYRVSSIQKVRIDAEGDWYLVSATLKDAAGKTRKGVLIASNDDLEKGAAELVLTEGDAKGVKRIRVMAPRAAPPAGAH